MKIQAYRFVSLFTVIALICLLPVRNVFGTDISAKAYLVMEASLGQLTAAKNENVCLPMASTTKIMTAYLTLRQPDLHEEFTVDPDGFLSMGRATPFTGDRLLGVNYLTVYGDKIVYKK